MRVERRGHSIGMTSRDQPQVNQVDSVVTLSYVTSYFISLPIQPMNVSEASLTEPLLTDGEEEFIGNVNDGGSRSSSQQDISEADNSNPADPNERTKADVDLNPSALHFTDLEYEPSDSSDNAQAPIKMIKVSQPQKKEALRTASEPVCVQCEHCNTVCETTVVQVFGMSTCLWICILLVICFPIAWIPLFWKDVSIYQAL